MKFFSTCACMASPLAAASASSAGSWLALKSASAFLPASTVIFSSRYCWAFCVYIVSYMEMSATSLACADWRVVMRCCMASLLGSSDTAGIWSSVPATPNRLIESVPAKLAARKPWRSHASFCTAGVFNRFSSVPPFLVQGHQRVGAPHGRRRVDDDHVVLDLLERIRLVHGQIKQLRFVAHHHRLGAHAQGQELVERILGRGLHPAGFGEDGGDGLAVARHRIDHGRLPAVEHRGKKRRVFVA